MTIYGVKDVGETFGFLKRVADAHDDGDGGAAISERDMAEMHGRGEDVAVYLDSLDDGHVAWQRFKSYPAIKFIYEALKVDLRSGKPLERLMIEKCPTQRLGCAPFEFLVEDTIPKTVQVAVKTSGGYSVGSGVIYRRVDEKRYYIVTNHHVVEDAGSESAVRVFALSGESERLTLKGRIVGSDPLNDVAVIEVTSEVSLPVAVFGNPSELDQGNPAFVVGHPLGVPMPVVTGGSFSQLRQRVAGMGPAGVDIAIQTDAGIDQGNSGGGIFAYNGRCYGLVTFGAATEAGRTLTSFAIPADIIGAVADGIIGRGGSPERGWLPIVMEPLNPQERMMLDTYSLTVPAMERGAGAKITWLDPDYGGYDGMKEGDIVISVGDETFNGGGDPSSAFQRIVLGKKTGEEIEIFSCSVLKDIATGEERASEGRITPWIEECHSHMVLVGSHLDQKRVVAKRWGFSVIKDEKGLLIDRVEEGSPAYGQVRPGQYLSSFVVFQGGALGFIEVHSLEVVRGALIQLMAADQIGLKIFDENNPDSFFIKQLRRVKTD